MNKHAIVTYSVIAPLLFFNIDVCVCVYSHKAFSHFSFFFHFFFHFFFSPSFILHFLMHFLMHFLVRFLTCLPYSFPHIAGNVRLYIIMSLWTSVVFYGKCSASCSVYEFIGVCRSPAHPFASGIFCNTHTKSAFFFSEIHPYSNYDYGLAFQLYSMYGCILLQLFLLKSFV